MGDVAPLPQSGEVPVSTPEMPAPPPIPPVTPQEIPLPPPVPETLVIPPAGPSNENPFIPQTDVPASKPPGAQFPKWLLLVLILVVLGIVGYFGMKLFSSGAKPLSKDTTITYWGLWEDTATVQTVINDFQTSHPNIKVQYVKQSQQQYRERLQAAITRGEGPDVFRFHNTWVPMLRNELAPAPTTVMTPAEFTSTFYPVASADLVGGSSVYGIPMMIDGLALIYNQDMLTAAGVQPPTTWPEVLNSVPKLTVKTGSTIQTSAIALGTTGNVVNFSDIVALMLLQDGARLVNPTGKEAEETLLFYRKFSNPSDPVYTWNDAMDNSLAAFASGRVAMIIAPSWRVFDIKQMNPTLRFQVAPVPQLPGNTVNWASYWVEGVSTKSKHQDAAWQFVSFITKKEEVMKLYEEASKTRLFGPPYARVELGPTIQDDPYVGAYIKQASTAKSFPLASFTYDNGLNDRLIQYLTDAVNAVNQGVAPTQALETASQGFAQVLTSFGLSAPAAPTTTP